MVNNQATQHGVLSQYRVKSITTISYANCISNACPKDFPLIRKVESKTFTVQYSNFISNTAHGSIFSSDISVSYCYLSKNNVQAGTNIKQAYSEELSIVVSDPECIYLDNGFTLEIKNLYQIRTREFKNYPHIPPILLLLLFVFQYE